MKEPPITCPIINHAQDCIKEIFKELDKDEPEKSDIAYNLQLIKDLLEEIRQANENLREWGRNLEKLL